VVTDSDIEDPRLRFAAEQLSETLMAAMLCDDRWNIVWVSDELKALLGEDDEGKLGYGDHIAKAWRTDLWSMTISDESRLAEAAINIPFIAHDTEGGFDQIMEWFREAGKIEVDVPFSVEPMAPPTLRVGNFDFLQGDLPPFRINQFFIRLHDPDGNYFGNALIYDARLPATITSLVVRGDTGMFRRMSRLVEPGRRAAAILFADLESSTQLARKLSSAAYFSLIKAITTGIDEVVVSHEGIVGKHAGDGVTAFFLAQDCGTPSMAARAAIQAARDITQTVRAAAEDLIFENPSIKEVECRVNVGVHWGSNLYMGQLVTGGRLEVTALGDEVNECARILQSAGGGQALASKVLIEQLDDADASQLDLDPDTVRYHTVEELPGATEKSVRDARGIPVALIGISSIDR
jgi:class 3 adenylate cyclase